jgi:Nucleotidyl transferase AbiEii toxin, Type IV TA system
VNPVYVKFLTAPAEDRRDAFIGAARRLGTTEQNIEKDFWVCWTLDALFNGTKADGPRLLFKGGTSLSKAYGLISRFSEDIDITIFRDDIGQSASVEELESLSGTQRRTRHEAIKSASQTYINHDMLAQLTSHLQETLKAAGMLHEARVERDIDDQDKQSLLVWYPTVTATDETYIRPAIKVESGAKSALDPNRTAVIVPYVSSELAELNLQVTNVTTVVAERTFWDKVVILHGLRQWFEKRGVLRGGGQRVSRHYYDVHRLLESKTGREAASDFELAADCVRHARMFFNSPDLNLATAIPGSYTLMPNAEMSRDLSRDYNAMSGMIFGDPPKFEEILGSVKNLETQLNTVHDSSSL